MYGSRKTTVKRREKILAFICKHGSVTAREVAEHFDIASSMAGDDLDNLWYARMIHRERAKGSVALWTAKK